MKIYLAAPYTSDNEEEISFRIKEINLFAGHLMSLNYIIYSPLSMFHTIAKDNNFPISADFYSQQNEEFIKWCDYLFILCLPKWEKSKGIKEEIKMARKYSKGIIYIKIK